MFEIEMHEVSDEFASCWETALVHLDHQVQGGSLSWIKANLDPPFLEHASFRVGNQLFFIHIVDVDGRVHGPGNLMGFRLIAKKCNGHALLMPMEHTESGWIPTSPNWGLTDPDSDVSINPLDLVTAENIEMTDWELLDFAVQVVRDYMREQPEFENISTLSNPGVNPSIWCDGPSGLEWVVVRADRYPSTEARMPDNISDISEQCQGKGNVGYFASVVFANSEDAFDPVNNGVGIKLWRGHSVMINFQGLQRLCDS